MLAGQRTDVTMGLFEEVVDGIPGTVGVPAGLLELLRADLSAASSLPTVNFTDDLVGVVVAVVGVVAGVVGVVAGVVVAGVFAAAALLFDEVLPHPAMAIATAPTATSTSRRISTPRS